MRSRGSRPVFALLVLLACNGRVPTQSEPAEDCKAYCRGLTCMEVGDQDEFLETCFEGCTAWLENAANSGEVCEQAFAAGVACTSGLTCEELESFVGSVQGVGEYPCSEEEDEIENACTAVGLR